MGLDAILIGTGHYAIGLTNQDKTTDKDFGVLLPSLMILREEGLIDNISVVGTGSNNSKVRDKIDKITNMMLLKGLISNGEHISLYPKDDVKSNRAYLEAFVDARNEAMAFIATPDSTHKDIVLDCINYNVNFFVVKPIVTKVEDLDKIVAAKKGKDIIGMVDYHKVFDEHNTLIKSMLSKDKIGNIHNIITRQTQRISMQDIYKKRLTDVNINHYLGSHYIHMISFLTNAVPVSIIAKKQTRFNANTPDMIETFVTWEHPKGYNFTSFHIAGWCDPNSSSSMTYQDMQIIGAKGNIVSDQKKRGFEVLCEDGIENPNPYFFNLDTANIRSQYGFISVDRFVNHVLHKCDRRYIPTVEDSYRVTRILEAVDKSLQTGREVLV